MSLFQRESQIYLFETLITVTNRLRALITGVPPARHASLYLRGCVGQGKGMLQPQLLVLALEYNSLHPRTKEGGTQWPNILNVFCI